MRQSTQGEQAIWARLKRSNRADNGTRV